MGKLKWFSGGKERKVDASLLIEELLIDLKDDSTKKPLEEVLMHFKEERKLGESSTPFILSRFNLAVSKVLKDNQISLTDSQTEALKKIRDLSHIRYGF
ncbi:bacteriocin immunity protein [Streptococcus pluranimalium]|uniref:bacteriocin immunity protein n=1 Tax=Streptococcus pluranimalium TaxID=82348 RepID=UPI003F690B3E